MARAVGDGETFKILVVDDEVDVAPMFQQRMRREIRSGVYDLRFACNGVEAVRCLEEGDIDLVITDINMPEMDGLELLRRMGQMELDTKAVVLSAYGDMSNIRGAMNLGAFDFVLKPLDFAEIKVTIERTLNNLIEWRNAVASKEQLVILNRDLDIASQIQRSVLPAVFPAMDGYSVYAMVDPARTVAGDFYDVVELDGGKVGFVIADVSGKGIPAAMLMMSSRTVMRNAVLVDDDPGRVLASVNLVICEENEMSMFVTAFFGVIDPENGVVVYANAGHPSPVVVGADGSCRRLPDSDDAVLGMLDDEQFSVGEVSLMPGECLVAVTDGVTEALNREDEMFGMDRLVATMEAVPGLSAEAAAKGLASRVKGFSDGRVQFDDITCLVVRRDV